MSRQDARRVEKKAGKAENPELKGKMDISALLSDTLAGHRLTCSEGEVLLSLQGRDLLKVISAADEAREMCVGDTITYVCNQNIHLTNICKNLCGFCGFGRRKEDPGAYCDDRETIVRKASQALSRRVTEICLLSGVHPDFHTDTYTDIISWTRDAAPGVHLHAFSPDEVAHASARSGISTREVLMKMRKAGLSSLQGTAAEILVDSVREVICPRKIRTAEWVRIIREAHALGIQTTATIMYGSCETAADRIAHLGVLRDIQDETGGFTELVPLPYVYQQTPLFLSGKSRPGPTGREDLLLHAVSRLFLDNFRNIQVSWGKLGLKMGQMALMAGANDLSGTMFTDDVTADAGSGSEGYFDPSLMACMAADLGRPLRQRSTLYELI